MEIQVTVGNEPMVSRFVHSQSICSAKYFHENFSKCELLNSTPRSSGMSWVQLINEFR